MIPSNLDKDLRSNKEIQEQFKKYINEKRFVELSKLIENTQTKPAEFLVRLGYKSYMEETQSKRVKLFYIMKLKEITGIKPEKNTIKEACEIAFRMDTAEILEALIKRVEIEKNSFKEMLSSIQQAYVDYVKEGRFVDISKLMELTDTRPDETTILNGYAMYLEEGKFISFSGLKKRTGVPPDPMLIQEMYRKYYFNYTKAKRTNPDQANNWMDNIKKLRRISKIDPEGITIEEDAPAAEETGN